MTDIREDIVQHSYEVDTAYNDFPPWLKDRLEWFRDLRFGFFTHWGIYSQWGCIESWPLVEADTWARPDNLACWNRCDQDIKRFQCEYRKLNHTFNPVKFDPDHWADVAEAAGTRYLAFTTKHHDGFCMFDTATTDYRITHPTCPFHAHPRANVTREIFDAFRRKGMGISCYFSKPDWHSPDYWIPGQSAPARTPNYDPITQPQRWERFICYTHAQIRELMSSYGPIDALWLDGGWIRPPEYDLRIDDMAAMARILQPQLILVDRTVTGKHENILTPEQEVPKTPIRRPWETCMTAGTSWSYRPDETYKSSRVIVHTLIDVMSKGGNFLLNVGMAPDGSFPIQAEKILREVGTWVRPHAECIYRSRLLEPYRDGKVRFVARGPWTYALIPLDEGQQPPASVSWAGHLPPPGCPVELLGVGIIPSQIRDGRITLDTANLSTNKSFAWCFRFRAGSARVAGAGSP